MYVCVCVGFYVSSKKWGGCVRVCVVCAQHNEGHWEQRFVPMGAGCLYCVGGGDMAGHERYTQYKAR